MQGKSWCREWTTVSNDLVTLVSKCIVVSSRVTQIWRSTVSRPCQTVKRERQSRAWRNFLCATSAACTSFVMSTLKTLREARSGKYIARSGGLLPACDTLISTTRILSREQSIVTAGLINCCRTYFAGMSSHSDAFSFGIDPCQQKVRKGEREKRKFTKALKFWLHRTGVDNSVFNHSTEEWLRSEIVSLLYPCHSLLGSRRDTPGETWL